MCLKLLAAATAVAAAAVATAGEGRGDVIEAGLVLQLGYIPEEHHTI